MSPNKSIKLVLALSTTIPSYNHFQQQQVAIPSSTSSESMLDKCQTALQTWQACMQIMGGNLELSKCHISVLQFHFDTFTYHRGPNFLGIPQLKQASEISGKCIIENDNGSGQVEIGIVNPNKGYRLLGVRLVLDGNLDDEFKFRSEKSRTMAGLLTNSAATPQDAYMIYTFQYCPDILYCTPITYFTQAQCDTIQKPFINAFLPKMRINRHIK